ncbi:MAG: energy-coupling factor transporter ATPase [Bacillota bacterium]|uniref:Energy-coupling factor transporter ATP-binding protein EcfA2 n=1 Tax=Thermanaerosceptrum fracticalcis TaxID=1712410 RepID=A0A7G6E5W9_THEFR|nr:energy-coupling factor transporter ATPase [Thermanaerosceptrum fracticalcis]QNB47473.1 energy-coupling factor transporter ATPase [Thermanaerosceptrum fracticalcis]
MSITLHEVYHTYQPNTPFEYHALRNISLEIKEGEFVGIIGHTGSGKSTLVQHFNGLLKATQGRVLIDGVDISGKEVKLKEIRQKVGLVFQYPEHQLFEETVAADIAFGPKNLGLSPDKIVKRVKKAMAMVKLDYERYKDSSPFVLSGGEKRRVAIAGVLAMEPKYLVLDEPTAGLDPKGRDEILAQIADLHREAGLTVVLVSHSMDDVARLASRLIVMHQGEVVYNNHPRQVFSENNRLKKIGLDIPTVTKLMIALKEKGWPVRTDILTIEEAKGEILKAVKGGKPHA